MTKDVKNAFTNIISILELMELSVESSREFEEIVEKLNSIGFINALPPNSIRAALKKAGKTYE